MRILWTVFIGAALFSGCGPSKNASKPNADYPKNVGDIRPDPALDDPKFSVCRENYIQQYYYSTTSGFRGEKPALQAFFREKFTLNPKHRSENGYITIRFVVNCRGEAGRFRVQEMGTDYLPKKFPLALTAHLLNLTKQLDGWLPAQHNGIVFDYYQYLTFVIASGDIAQILP